MFRRLYRQRRRIVFLIVMVAAALGVALINNDAFRYQLKHDFAGPTWLVLLSFAIAFLAVTLIGSAVVILFLPSARRALEVGGMAGLLVECGKHAVAILPDGAIVNWALGDWGSWVLFFGIFWGLSHLLEADTFGRVGLNVRYRLRASRVIAATPEAIWAATAPDADTIGTYWTRSLTRVDPVGAAEPDTFEARYKLGRHGTLIQRQKRRIWNRPLHLLYDFEREDGAGISGSYELRSEPLPDGKTQVEITHDYPALGFGTWSLLWLDDIAASELDAISARITGRRDWSIAGWAARKMAA